MMFNQTKLVYIRLLFVTGILKTLVSKSVVGAKVLELCELGDKMLLEETNKVFKKEKEMKKGL